MTATLSRPRQRPCRAKDPSTCLYHGKAKVTAETLYHAFMKEKKHAPVAPKAYVGTPAALVQHAVAAPLGWSGSKPAWWDAHVAAVANEPQIPTSVELIDVIDSPLGRLAVVWQEESNDKVDRSVTLDSGIAVHVMAYKNFDTGETVGYVKQQFMTDATFNRSFGTDEFAPFRWHERYSGHNMDLKDWDARRAGDRGPGFANLTDEALIAKRREVWAGAIKTGLIPAIVNGQRVPSYNVNAKNAPDDAAVRKDLRRAAMKLQPDIQESKTHYAVPFVDYSEVNDGLRARGFGAALYVYTARKLAERGQVLRASGLQSEEAESVWSKFATHMPEHVGSITLSYHRIPNTNAILDFRTR